MKKSLYALVLIIGFNSFGQKKVLQHADKDIWNVIKNQSISNDVN